MYTYYWSSHMRSFHPHLALAEILIDTEYRLFLIEQSPGLVQCPGDGPQLAIESVDLSLSLSQLSCASGNLRVMGNYSKYSMAGVDYPWSLIPRPSTYLEPNYVTLIAAR